MPKPFWKQGNEDDEEAGKAVEKKFETLETTVKEIKDNGVTKTEFTSLADGVKAINDRFAREDAARTKAENDRKAREAREAVEGYDPAKEFETFAADPAGYIQNQAAPASRAALLSLGRQARQDILGGKEYYHGDFKKEVDRTIESGTSDYRQLSNPEYVLNCYRLVMAKYMEEGKLQELKKQASMHGMGDGSGSGDTGQDTKPTVNFRGDSVYTSDKAKFAAAQLGLKDEDIVKAAEEGTIRGLEVLA